MALMELEAPQEAPQHMKALDRANRIRLRRAETKREVRAGLTTVEAVLRELPEHMETYRVGDLLMCQHRWGRTRMRRFLASLPMSEMKTLGALSERQREQIVARLNGKPIEPAWPSQVRQVPVPQPKLDVAELVSWRKRNGSATVSYSKIHVVREGRLGAVCGATVVAFGKPAESAERCGRCFSYAKENGLVTAAGEPIA